MGICGALAGSRAAWAETGVRDAARARGKLSGHLCRLTGRITAFALVDLRVMGDYDWRLADRNVWKVERMLLETKHQPLRMPEARFRDFRRRYRAFKELYPDRKPLFYEGREKWTPIPRHFLGQPRRLVSPKRRKRGRDGAMGAAGV